MGALDAVMGDAVDDDRRHRDEHVVELRPEGGWVDQVPVRDGILEDHHHDIVPNVFLLRNLLRIVFCVRKQSVDMEHHLNALNNKKKREKDERENQSKKLPSRKKRTNLDGKKYKTIHLLCWLQ